MASASDGRRADAAVDWCHGAVQDVSRTFALTIEILADPMATYICVGYLLCRIPDTIEDAGHIPATVQAELLALYERALDPSDDTEPDEFVAAAEEWVPEEPNADWRVVERTPKVFRAFAAQPAPIRRAVRGPVRELVTGMATFVERYADRGGLRLRTPAELERYCHYAAGTVGELITNIVCRADIDEETEATLRENSESFGQLLQHVNIAKDVHDDFSEEDNVYLPAESLASHDVDQEEVLAEENREGAAAVVRETADTARGFLDDAEAYLGEMPERQGNRVAAWSVPFLLAVGTLRELDAHPTAALTGEGVKVSREEVEAVVAVAVSEGADADLAHLRERIASEPFDA